MLLTNGIINYLELTDLIAVQGVPSSPFLLDEADARRGFTIVVLQSKKVSTSLSVSF